MSEMSRAWQRVAWLCQTFTRFLEPTRCTTATTATTVAASSQISTLRNAVEFLKFQCDSLTSRFEANESRLDSMDTRIDSLVASFDNLTSRFTTNDTTLQSLLEAQQVIITSVTTLTEKLDLLATHLECCYPLMQDLYHVTNRPLPLASPLPPHLAAVLPRNIFDNQVMLHVISWNDCGIGNWAKLFALKGYVYSHHPDVILIQEPFAGNAQSRKEFLHSLAMCPTYI